MDTSTPFILNWGGVFEDGRYIGYNDYYLTPQFEIAGDIAMREIFDAITPDSFKWRYETTADGGKTWAIKWTLDYRRRASIISQDI
ncbi:MAG: hypothetical protein KJ043_20690 [Anaerolineae bacterium]|nr:hypothetical protein [Anaerolineae bacterium]